MKKKLFYLIIAVLLLPAVLIGCSCSQQDQALNDKNVNTKVVENVNQETSVVDADIQAMKDLDGTIYQMKSTDGKVSGQMGLEFTETDDGYQYLNAAVYLVIEEALPAKPANLWYSTAAGYFQISHLTKQGEERDGDSGATIPRFCGQDVEINIMDSFDDFMGLTDHLSVCSQELGTETAFMDPLFFTDHFHTIFTKYDYTNIEDYNKYVIFDGSQYQVAEDYDGSIAYTTDIDKAVAEGPIYKEYTLTYSK